MPAFESFLHLKASAPELKERVAQLASETPGTIDALSLNGAQKRDGATEKKAIFALQRFDKVLRDLLRSMSAQIAQIDGYLVPSTCTVKRLQDLAHAWEKRTDALQLWRLDL
ncbi:hypothetical protein BC834DRAFT_965781 [Gloeopeniophorella convolvens]|nr:hypothetical protein BC834DRAFT_965781 [Gloeopeniophorella convolvens]